MERKSSDREKGNESSSDRQRGQEQESSPSNGASSPVASLHHVGGNQTVQRLYESGEIQASLSVSQPNDPAEREAERVAERVMRTSDPGPISDTRTDTEVNRQGTAGSPLNAGTRERIKSVTNGGKPILPSTRSYFEPRFGRDFSDVRVHTGQQASRAAESIDADAFTHGKDIVFRRGKYDPHSRDGKELLAHELTHVVQQNERSDRIHRQKNQETMVFPLPWPRGMQGTIPGGTVVSTIDLKPIHNALKTNNGKGWDPQFPDFHKSEVVVPFGTNQDWWSSQLDNMNNFTSYELPGLRSTMLNITPRMQIKAEIADHTFKGVKGQQSIQMGSGSTGGASVSTSESSTEGTSATAGGEVGGEGAKATGEVGASQSRTESKSVSRQGNRSTGVSGDAMIRFRVTLKFNIKIDATYDALGASTGGFQDWYAWDKGQYFPSSGTYTTTAILEIPKRKCSPY